MVRAAVLSAVNAPLAIADIELPAPGPGQVRVRLAAAGVCHSDLSLSNGTLRQPVPAVLGHEGAGTVVSVGDGVTGLAPGDRVVLNWAPSCGACHYCALGEPWLCANAGAAAAAPYAKRAAGGDELYPGLGTAAFAEETVVPATAVLPLPDGVPLTEAALLGCAVLTGYGAVHHSSRRAFRRVRRRLRCRRSRPRRPPGGPHRRLRGDDPGRRRLPGQGGSGAGRRCHRVPGHAATTSPSVSAP